MENKKKCYQLLSLNNFSKVKIIVLAKLANDRLLYTVLFTLALASGKVLHVVSNTVWYFCCRCLMHTFVVLLGALFAILASAESLCNFCSQLIFNPLYTWTINELKGKFVAGITFFINAGILLIPVTLIG